MDIEELLKNPIILELARKSIPFTVENQLIRVDGFYKSDCARLSLQSGKLIAETRYNQVDEINKFEDLVYLNYDWWLKSKDRSDAWKKPDGAWRAVLLEYKYVTSYIYQEEKFE